jgi:arsenical pump membrane protein
VVIKVVWQVVQMTISGILLIAVLALVIIRPHGLNVAWSAGVGALLAILVGLLPLPTLLTIFDSIWDAAATLIALFLLSEALDSNGFFTWGALHLARFAHGSGWRLYVVILLLTTAVTALLANDGAVLMLTPIFGRLLLKIYPKEGFRLPFLFAAGFFADAMSGIFVPSNLTNIIVADATHLSFLRFAEWMALPMFAAFVAGTLAFALRFRRQISMAYDVSLIADPWVVIRDRTVFWLGWIALGVLVIGYAIGSQLGYPVSLVAGLVALSMVLLVHIRHLSSAQKVLVAAPWSILIYALAMFVVITAAFQSQILSFLTHPLLGYVETGAGTTGALLAGSILALWSASVNNLPATLTGVLVLHGAVHTNPLAIYAITLGVDIGPKFTPFGSLATLLWLGILARNGIHITWRSYLRENWWVTLIVLIASFAGLLASNALLK